MMNRWSDLLCFTFCFSSNFKKSEDPTKWGSESLGLCGDDLFSFAYVRVKVDRLIDEIVHLIWFCSFKYRRPSLFNSILFETEV